MPLLGFGAVLRPRRSNKGQQPLKQLIQQPSALPDWSELYINLLEGMLQDRTIFPYRAWIYRCVERYEFAELLKAWKEAVDVYHGVISAESNRDPQTLRSTSDFLQGNMTPEERLKEGELLFKLELDRFALPPLPEEVRGSPQVLPYSDYAILKLCHDEAICANKRHAASTFANEVLKSFEKKIVNEKLSNCPLTKWYANFIRAHKEICNYFFSKQRFRAKGLCAIDIKEALEPMLHTGSLPAFIKYLLEFTADSSKVNGHLHQYEQYSMTIMATDHGPQRLQKARFEAASFALRIRLQKYHERATKIAQLMQQDTGISIH